MLSCNHFGQNKCLLRSLLDIKIDEVIVFHSHPHTPTQAHTHTHTDLLIVTPETLQVERPDPIHEASVRRTIININVDL